MKYENNETIQKMVKKIQDYEKTLDLVDSDIVITIKRRYAKDGIDFYVNETGYDHERAVNDFVKNVKESIESKIDILKLQLKDL